MNNLSRLSDEDLQAELERRKKERKNAQYIDNLNPVGTWKVTTEGDCEGKSVKSLGTHVGHVADIAFALRTSAMYNLNFSPVPVDIVAEKPVARTGDEVHLQMDISAGTWDMQSPARVNAVRRMLQRGKSKSGYSVKESNYFACATLVKD
jgi:hypothetical protein